MKPKLLSFILCDDIRLEVGEKKTLIGIYSDIIYVPTIPYTMPKLGFLIRLIELDHDKKYKVAFKIMNIKTEENILKIEDSDINISKTESSVSDIVYIFSPVILNSEGSFKIILELTGEETYIFNSDFKVALKSQ